MSIAINSKFIQNGGNSASLPVKENVLLLDPMTRATDIGSAEQTTFDIPTSDAASGSFIDMQSSYLELTVVPVGSNTAKARLNVAGIHGLIDSIDVESSNYVVEHSANWNRMYQTLADIHDTDEDRTGFKAYSQGLSGKRGADSVTTGSDVASLTTHTTVDIPERKGRELPEIDGNETGLKFCIPIPSQQLQNGRHVPVWAISKLRYSITWAKALDALVTVSGNITGFKINNPRLHLVYLEMSSKSREVINSKSPLKWSHSIWESFKDNVVETTKNQSFRYPSHKSSVKTLMATFHHANASNKAAVDVDYCSRTNPDLVEYQYRINGIYHPQNPVDLTGGGIMGMTEVKRAFHSLTNNSGSQVTNSNYVDNDKDKAKSTFVIAVNTESNVGRSQSSYAGVSTLQEAPLLNCTFGTAVPTETLLCCHFDQMNVIENGIWKVSN